MNTEGATPLVQRDYLDMGISIIGLQRIDPQQARCRIAFRLHLRNKSSQSIKLLGRKWILRDKAGRSYIIEAEQIFNQHPILSPGAVFGYSGSQELREGLPSQAELRFFGQDHRQALFITPALSFPIRELIDQRK